MSKINFRSLKQFGNKKTKTRYTTYFPFFIRYQNSLVLLPYGTYHNDTLSICEGGFNKRITFTEFYGVTFETPKLSLTEMRDYNEMVGKFLFDTKDVNFDSLDELEKTLIDGGISKASHMYGGTIHSEILHADKQRFQIKRSNDKFFCTLWAVDESEVSQFLINEGQNPSDFTWEVNMNFS